MKTAIPITLPTHTLERWPSALPHDVIDRCLPIVEIALNHGNREEALAAIERAFAHEGAEPVTVLSPLADLHLPLRIAGALERRGVITVGDLCLMRITDLYNMVNFGRCVVREIETALFKHGLGLSNELLDKPTPQWAVRLMMERT